MAPTCITKLSAAQKCRTTAIKRRATRLHVAEPGGGRGLTFDLDARRRQSRLRNCRWLSLTAEPLVVVRAIADRGTPVVAIWVIAASPTDRRAAVAVIRCDCVVAFIARNSSVRARMRQLLSACPSQVELLPGHFAGTFCDVIGGRTALLYIVSMLYHVLLCLCVFCLYSFVCLFVYAWFSRDIRVTVCSRFILLPYP